jgi:hypothetical protein
VNDHHDPMPVDEPRVFPEVRTRRLALVSETGTEHAVAELKQGMVELRLGGPAAGLPCEVLIYAGEQVPGVYAAGVEFYVDGNGVAGNVLTVTGSEVTVHHFEPGDGD